MVGSSQNIALSNIVINTAVAESLSIFADALEETLDFDGTLDSLIADTFRRHSRILFSGNSYSQEWEEEAARRGLSNFKTSPEAYAHFTDEKNIALFGKFGVMSETEMRSRREIFFESYRKIKNIEARVMLEMTARDIIPAVSKYIGSLTESVNARLTLSKTANISAERDIIEKLSNLLSAAWDAYNALELSEKVAISKTDCEEAAFYYKTSVIPKMDALRKCVDSMEILTAREYWPMPTYGDITFRV
jgi:glutamine synthetase